MSGPEGVGEVDRGERGAAEVVVHRGRGSAVAELVRDVADAEALVVEAGGDRFAEDVAAHPGVARRVERLAQVGLGVGGVADQPGWGGEDHPARSRRVTGQPTPLDHAHEVLR